MALCTDVLVLYSTCEQNTSSIKLSSYSFDALLLDETLDRNFMDEHIIFVTITVDPETDP